jgi:hypothetical protein
VILGLVGRKQLERIKGLEASPASIEKTKAVLTRKPIPTSPSNAASSTATTTAPGTAAAKPRATTPAAPVKPATPAAPATAPKPPTT